LVVDAAAAHARTGADGLEAEGYRVDVATRGEDGLKRLEEREYDLVVTDLFLGPMSGFEVLKAARAHEPPTEVIVVTGHGSVESAVEAMARGALTYLGKPLNLAELRAVVRKALERAKLERRTVELERQLDKRYGFEAIVGNSPKMLKVFEVLRQAAPTNATVLILGETGTGKELIAKTVHQNSPRRLMPFVALNCAALSESILESELFGHEKGSFTGAAQQRKGRFEYAHKGTLFLDEVGDMPLPTQIKLLRVLEEREITRVGSNVPIKVDVRLIAATNQDLEKFVAEGKFRQELYFRLRVVTIRLPALRERPSDIPLLTEAFLREYAKATGKPVDGITPEARRMLAAYPWPGNVRELRNAIETMVTIGQGPILGVDQLPDYIKGRKPEPKSLDGLAGLSMEDVEREHIRSTLALTEGNREAAARLLGIGERTLYRKINKYGLR
ncbi:MAG TPA: sigma-54 dependent transcriptional regulator, partial [Planctomycetota bacterium]|nr:sigma-54 dependent transcriptional regulator [Planctomycetota bacterium]